jgi:adenine-specific DNA-methyltransferase
MRDRLEIMRELLKDDGAIFVSIDKNERTILEHVMNIVFKPENKVEELIWTQNTNDGKSPTYSTNHEYVEVFSKRKEAVENDKQMFREPKPGYEEVMALIAELNLKYPLVSKVEEALTKLYEDHKRDYRESIEAEGLNFEEEKRNDPWKGLFNYAFAEYRDKDGRLVPERDARARKATLWVFRESDWTIMSSETKQSDTIRDPNHKNFRYYRPTHPVTGKPCNLSQRGWKGTQFIDPEHPERNSLESLVNDHRIAFGPDENKVPQQKRMLHEVETNVCKSVFVDYSDGEKELMALFNKAGLFLAPKHTRFVTRFILQSTRNDSIILDCFAGSGSTAHAVINLNREESARRKYILVEVGDYFHTLIKPRVCKAAYSSIWKDGKPKTRTGGISHCFKYLQLESYEDALANITFQAPDAQVTLQLEDYALSYMLDFETKQSDTLLNVAKLDAPFDYTLRRQGRDAPLPVDLPETFNYLIGLNVASRRMYENRGIRYLVYRGRAEDRDTVILWRTTRGWKKEQFEADRDFVAKQKLTEDAEDIFVNTDSFIPRARSLDPVFKRRMFNEE